MKLADFQKYLRALADAVAASKGASKDLNEAANALSPFAHHTMAEFAEFLRLAEVTYRETGGLPISPVRQPKKEQVTAEQLNAAIRGIRERIEQREPLTRAGVAAELSKFESLPKGTLDAILQDMGYRTKAKTKKVVVELIADRLLAGSIAGARSEI